MTVIKIAGFKIFRDKKPPYAWRCYHRKTGLKIDLAKAPIGSAAFVAECAKITALSEAAATKAPKAGTLGTLITCYYSEQHFKDLAPRTKDDYRKVAKYVDPVLDTPAHLIDTPLVAGMHAKAKGKIGWRQANVLLTFLSEVFRFAVPHGLINGNPAKGVIPHPRPKDLPRANQPWEVSELEYVLTTAPPHVAAGIAFISNTGMDPSDALHLRRSVIKDGEIWLNRAKTGEPTGLKIGKRLRTALDAAPAHDAITVLANSDGKPWTYSGYSSSWHTYKAKQVKDGKLSADLTLKGLRHMVATILRELGYTPRQIADLLGQKTDSMALWYSRDANLIGRNSATVDALDAEIEKRTEVVKLAAKGVKP